MKFTYAIFLHLLPDIFIEYLVDSMSYILEISFLGSHDTLRSVSFCAAV